MPHKTKLVTVGRNSEQIDVNIAPLIEELWKRNINTTNSCQSNPTGFIWIQFMSAMDAELFLNIVTRGNHKVYENASGFSNKKDWMYNVSTDDINSHLDFDDDEKTVDIIHEGYPKFMMFVSIRFPKSDLAAVLEAIKNSPEDDEELCDKFMFFDNDDDVCTCDDDNDKIDEKDLN
jgi:hypothetical protein